MAEEKKIKRGRPKKQQPLVEDKPVNETNTERLDMDKKEKITIDTLGAEWKATINKIAAYENMAGKSNMADDKTGINTVVTQWNKLNPFLQNQRIKNLYTRAKAINKQNLGEMLEEPGNHEMALRASAWSSSSSQQIYYNILRRSSDIPEYYYYTIPEVLEASEYKEEDFDAEDELLQRWLELFNIPTSFKTIALQVKREGKQSYLLRNKIDGQGKNRRPVFCALQKLPTDWIKITGIGQLGFTVSFNMMYFLNIANSPEDFGEYIEKAWDDMVTNGVVKKDEAKNVYELDIVKAKDYSFSFEGESYSSIIEGVTAGRNKAYKQYMFWLRLPYDMVFTFGSDNSAPWVAPDTMGLLQKLQELNDYGQLAGLIASTPLTAILTGEIETITDSKAGRNESVFSPEVIKGYQDMFNAATSTNVEAIIWPAKNIKLQQLSSDVNSSEIISTATENFIETAGEGGLSITTSKPNVSQVKTAQMLAASAQNYVTLQFENVMNFIIQHKLGLNYHWKIRIWGDIFANDNDRKFLKEVVANGNIAMLPKLMSAERISIRDTKAITEYIKTLGFYKDFMTYTQLKNAELQQQAKEEEDEEGNPVGRPGLDDNDIDNDSTAKSRDDGTNTSDNRD